MKLKNITMLAGLSLMSSHAIASNWLMLQGTEPSGSAPRAKVWGFVQPEYQSMSGTKLKAGPFKGQDMSPNLVKPDNKTESAFNIRRARIGIRGTNLPLDPNVNYFVLAEMGNNGITTKTKSIQLTDASITLNHIDGARIRIGQFKTPTAEEGLQAIHVFNYVNFTAGTDQLLLERFTDGDGSDGNGQPALLPDGTPNPTYKATTNPNGVNGPVGAFRDVGIQVFDAFKQGDWEHSYAVMLGNGNGINRSDNDDNKDTYVYWSSELVYGGKGARREGLKLFAWNHSGKRTLTTSGAGEYDRDRRGIGMTYLKDKVRAAAEYIKADGMIFNGSDGGAVPGASNNAGDNISTLNVLTEDEADAYYLDFGYKILPNLELDLRYDVLNRGTETTAGEREFETITLGAQYFFNKKSRMTINYELRDQEAPGFPASAPPNLIADSLDDRLSLQWLVIF